MRLIDVDAINDFHIDFSSYKECPDEDDIKAWLDEQTTIEAEPVRHGEWVWSENGGYHCSVCDKRFGFVFDNNYCPNCGAKMDGDAE